MNKTKQFIEKARAIHGDKYDYSQVEYRKAILKVQIICPLHGMFMQAPNPHLSGVGCPICGCESIGKKLRCTKEKFIQKAHKVHGAKYDYTEAKYVGAHTNVKIICPEHGAFKQSPTAHLSGAKCPNCSVIQVANLRRISSKEFIERAHAVHNNKYDYSCIEQEEGQEKNRKVVIVCPQHGPFIQRRNNHLRGVGCPFCAAELTARHWVDKSNGRKATLYFLMMHRLDECFYKIGVTYVSLTSRYRIARLNGYQYHLLAMYISSDSQAIFEWEQSIIETFAHLRYKPLHHFQGESECFSEAESILAALPFGTKFYEVEEAIHENHS